MVVETRVGCCTRGYPLTNEIRVGTAQHLYSNIQLYHARPALRDRSPRSVNARVESDCSE